MGAKPRSWWQIARKSLAVVEIIVACMLGITLIVVIALAYIFNVNIPGLHGKTLWDWLQLLIIPLVLAVIALLFNRATTRTDQKIAAERYEQDIKIATRHYHNDQLIATQRYEQDQQIALDKQHEDLLQIYLDRISELLLEKNLRTSPSEEVRNVARVRTTTILIQLDERRVGYVFAFLLEAGLMSTTTNDSAVSLSQADLHAVNWSRADLTGANLSGAMLWEANLTDTLLMDANLSEADLFRANLSKAALWGADLSEADLEGADLSEANLEGAKVTEEQLKTAKSLKGATMPDGSIHP